MYPDLNWCSDLQLRRSFPPVELPETSVTYLTVPCCTAPSAKISWAYFTQRQAFFWNRGLVPQRHLGWGWEKFIFWKISHFSLVCCLVVVFSFFFPSWSRTIECFGRFPSTRCVFTEVQTQDYSHSLLVQLKRHWSFLWLQGEGWAKLRCEGSEAGICSLFRVRQLWSGS